MEYPKDKKKFIKEFANRTIENYTYIKSREGAPDFSVTQLINSFLGLIVFPSEGIENYELLSELRKKKLDQINWLEFEYVAHPEIEENTPQEFGDFIRFLRHGIAHGLLDFETEGETKEISAILIRNDERRYKGMKVRIRIEQIDK